MEELLVPVIYGSVRSDRQGIRAARYLVAQLQQRGARAVLVDPKEHSLPLLDRMYKEYERGTAPPALEELATLFRNADGFAIVSGEYNHGVPPALSNLMDYFLEEYFWRPAAVVTYSNGQFGGVRAGYALRSMLAEMGMVTIPSMLPIPFIQNAFDEACKPSDPKTDKYSARFLDEFFWYVRALKNGRRGGVPY